jgi:hypothetical protein
MRLNEEDFKQVVGVKKAIAFEFEAGEASEIINFRKSNSIR